ncbi:MAG: xanthine dehydrogenase family protein subunit M [Acidobacteria bacterium]|nr:xanthine dehydrogenase family protein subunit M [Acidobacteriota bacterium]MBI3663059.1 xanthine dehydrogenase family protein subunit M [Acidobacteriota bacterium]
MNVFEYANPTTTKEAAGLLAAQWGEAEILAGGTDLLSLMKNYVATPKRVVSLRGIKELSGITSSASGLRIGAMVTLQELHDHKAVHDDYHSLAHAAGSVPSPQIRNLGTVGGDLCQRPRCWYFRNGFGLLAKDEKGQPLVPAGDNRYHAIFGHPGGSPGAYYVHPSSLAPALITFGARVKVAGPKGEREIPLASFFATPKREGERENVLMPNEIVTEIILAAASKGMLTATYEVRQKEALDWPLATASVALRMSGDKVKSARIVLGHVAPVPWPAHEAEKLLAGQTITEDSAAKAGEAAVRGAKALSGNKYKVQLARVAVKRALLEAAAHGKEGMQHG